MIEGKEYIRKINKRWTGKGRSYAILVLPDVVMSYLAWNLGDYLDYSIKFDENNKRTLLVLKKVNQT